MQHEPPLANFPEMCPKVLCFFLFFHGVDHISYPNPTLNKHSRTLIASHHAVAMVCVFLFSPGTIVSWLKSGFSIFFDRFSRDVDKTWPSTGKLLYRLRSSKDSRNAFILKKNRYEFKRGSLQVVLYHSG